MVEVAPPGVHPVHAPGHAPGQLQGGFPLSLSKRFKTDPKKDPKMNPKMDRKWTNANNVQNDFQPHTSPLTRTHTVKLPVRCNYSSFFSATRNREYIPSIDHSIVCLKSSFASLFEFDTCFGITHNIDQSSLNVHRCTNCATSFYF